MATGREKGRDTRAPMAHREARRRAAAERARALAAETPRAGRWEMAGPEPEALVTVDGGDDDDPGAALWRGCCERWGWDPAGVPAGALDFLVFDGAVPDASTAEACGLPLITAACARVPPSGDDAADIAAVVARVLDAWPRDRRRGPPPVPQMRPHDARETGHASAVAAADRAVRQRGCARTREGWSGTRVSVPH